MVSNLDFELMTSEMASDIRGGNRNSLAKAITIIESTRDDHRMLAEALLEKLFPYSGNSIRLGISGVPGVGKIYIYRNIRTSPDNKWASCCCTYSGSI